MNLLCFVWPQHDNSQSSGGVGVSPRMILDTRQMQLLRRLAKCDREWPVYRHQLHHLIMAGWKPMLVVNWCSRISPAAAHERDCRRRLPIFVRPPGAIPGYTAAIILATVMNAVLNFAIASRDTVCGPRSSELWNRALRPMIET